MFVNSKGNQIVESWLLFPPFFPLTIILYVTIMLELNFAIMFFKTFNIYFKYQNSFQIFNSNEKIIFIWISFTKKLFLSQRDNRIIF